MEELPRHSGGDEDERHCKGRRGAIFSDSGRRRSQPATGVMKTTLKLLVLCAMSISRSLQLDAADGAKETKLYSIALKDIDGRDTSLKPFAGKVLLIVNVASE